MSFHMNCNTFLEYLTTIFSNILERREYLFLQFRKRQHQKMVRMQLRHYSKDMQGFQRCNSGKGNSNFYFSAFNSIWFNQRYFQDCIRGFSGCVWYIACYQNRWRTWNGGRHLASNKCFQKKSVQKPCFWKRAAHWKEKAHERERENTRPVPHLACGVADSALRSQGDHEIILYGLLVSSITFLTCYTLIIKSEVCLNHEFYLPQNNKFYDHEDPFLLFPHNPCSGCHLGWNVFYWQDKSAKQLQSFFWIHNSCLTIQSFLRFKALATLGGPAVLGKMKTSGKVLTVLVNT